LVFPLILLFYADFNILYDTDLRKSALSAGKFYFVFDFYFIHLIPA